VPIGLSPLQSGSTFEATVQGCQRAEALGFDSAWLGERHNHPLLYLSSAFCNLPSPQCAGCTPDCRWPKGQANPRSCLAVPSMEGLGIAFASGASYAHFFNGAVPNGKRVPNFLSLLKSTRTAGFFFDASR
jgi:hypothetical protein